MRQELIKAEQVEAAVAGDDPGQDPFSACAIVDRLTFNEHILATGTTSYRPAQDRASRTKT